MTTLTIPVLNVNMVDFMHCPFCNETMAFKVNDYSVSHDHIHIVSCHRSWTTSKKGCGFSFVHDCTPHKPYGQAQENNFHYAKLLKERRLTLDYSVNIPTGTLLPLTVVGNSMGNAILGGYKYIMEVINNDMSYYEDGGIYSVILNGKPLCCRVFDTSSGFHLHKDNPMYNDALVKYGDVVIVGRLLINE